MNNRMSVDKPHKPSPYGWLAELRQIWLYALRDLRGNIASLGIFIACIAIGVGTIAGVYQLSYGLTNGIAERGQEILGGDLSFSLVNRKASEAEQAFLASKGTLSTIATLRGIGYALKNDEQSLIEVKAIDNAYPLVGELRYEHQHTSSALAKQGNIYGIAVEKSLLTRLTLEIGDKLRIGKADFTIRAVIENEPDKLSQGAIFGPRVLMSLQALEATELARPGALVRWSYRLTLSDSAENIAEIETAAHEQFPEAGWRINSRNNASPMLADNIRRFAQYLSLVGFTALLVGGAGIANAVRAYLDKKRPVIATFKALGASGSSVFGIYLMQIIIIATIGIVIGAFAGSLLPTLAGSIINSYLPVFPENSFSLEIVFLAALFGYLTALSFSLIPLSLTGTVSPADLFRGQFSAIKIRLSPKFMLATFLSMAALIFFAIYFSYDPFISIYFWVSAIVIFMLLRLVGMGVVILARRLPQVKAPLLRLAITNLHRPGALTASVMLSIGLGLTLLVTMTQVDSNFRDRLERGIQENTPSFYFVNIASSHIEDFEKLVAQNSKDATLDTVPMLRGSIVALKDVPARELTPPPEVAWVLRGDRGITFSENLPENSTLEKGEWWPENYKGEPLVSFEAEAGDKLGLAIGDKITVNILGRNIEAKIANFRKVNWESLSINFVMVFSPNSFAGAPYNYLATLTYSAMDDTTLEEQENKLLRIISAKYPTITPIRVRDALEQINALTRQIALGLQAASVLALLTSILVLAGALAASHRSRVYDAIILKTLGATRWKILGVYLLEYSFLGILAALFALLAGSICTYFIITELFQSEYVFFIVDALGILSLSLILMLFLGLFGSWRHLRQKATTVLRNL